jgi:hypothetical protein
MVNQYQYLQVMRMTQISDIIWITMKTVGSEKEALVRSSSKRRLTATERIVRKTAIRPLTVSVSSIIGLNTLMKAADQRMKEGQLRIALPGRTSKRKKSKERVERQNARVLETLESLRRQREQLIETMLPKLDEVPASATVLQARRSARARELLLKQWGGYTSAETGNLSGSTAKNRAATASRWKKEGKIFSVLYRGKTYFPSFQFDDGGQAVPVVADILSTLGRKIRSWDLALWFTASSGWLDGERPVDLLIRNPDAVRLAAQREAEELGG